MSNLVYESTLYHHGIKGQKWGVRRFQNKDGSSKGINKKNLRKFKKYGTLKNRRYTGRMNFTDGTRSWVATDPTDDVAAIGKTRREAIKNYEKKRLDFVEKEAHKMIRERSAGYLRNWGYATQAKELKQYYKRHSEEREKINNFLSRYADDVVKYKE